jgi:hypothetical protein
LVKELLGLGETALIPSQRAEVFQDRSQIWMVGAEDLFARRQGASQKLL